MVLCGCETCEFCVFLCLALIKLDLIHDDWKTLKHKTTLAYYTCYINTVSHLVILWVYMYSACATLNLLYLYTFLSTDLHIVLFLCLQTLVYIYRHHSLSQMHRLISLGHSYVLLWHNCMCPLHSQPCSYMLQTLDHMRECSK